MDYKLGDWKYKDNELVRAKTLVSDKNNSLLNISQMTGIPYQSLKNYRADISKLDRASWTRVHKLAGLSDLLRISDNMTEDNLTEVYTTIHKMFDRMRKPRSNSNRDMDIINIMEDVISNNPMAEYEIFKALKR